MDITKFNLVEVYIGAYFKAIVTFRICPFFLVKKRVPCFGHLLFFPVKKEVLIKKKANDLIEHYFNFLI